MQNWAIVIGVDHYPAEAGWTLNGAVRDAMAMRDWLLRPAGGDVAPEHLSLLLSPRPDDESSLGVAFTLATHSNIVGAVNRLLGVGKGQGDRSYFYFAGHGFSVDSDLITKPVILARDFALGHAHNSLTMMSLFEAFHGAHFEEQYFVIDACRTMSEGRIHPGKCSPLSLPRIPAPPQFVMYATQPQVEAVEPGAPGEESGALTTALLKGLSGEGAAKEWDDITCEYVVRWNELFSFVLEDVRKRKLPVADGRLIQEPRQYGERGNENPELGRFPDADVPNVKLSIALDPDPNVLGLATVKINTVDGVAREVAPPISDNPIVVGLRPRTYGVNGVVPWDGGHKTARTKTVKLYNPAIVKLEFKDGPPPPGPGTPMSQNASAAQRPIGGLKVSARESLALLQVANEAGTILATARGRISLKHLPLGFYSARMISPEGAVIAEEIVSPKPGGTRTVRLSGPSSKSPAMTYLTDHFGFTRGADGSISPSETIGPTFFLKTSTVLALAAAAQLEAAAGPGRRLRKVPLPSFHQVTGANTASGLHLVFGDERMEGFWTSATAFDIVDSGLRSTHHHRSMRDGGGDSGLLKSLAIGGESGRRTVRIKWADHETRIPCYVLPGRVTLLVITREMDDSIEFHQYMPSSGVATSTAPAYPAPNARDPEYPGSAFAAIRRIEYMQRAAAQGRISPVKPEIELLLQDKWGDPIAGCLGTYLAWQMGITEGLDVATSNLVQYFGELPDSHLLHALSLLQLGAESRAESAYDKARDIGPPLFREGETLLHVLWKELRASRNRAYDAARLASDIEAKRRLDELPDEPAHQDKPPPIKVEAE